MAGAFFVMVVPPGALAPVVDRVAVVALLADGVVSALSVGQDVAGVVISASLWP